MLNCKDITEQSDGYLAGDLGFWRIIQVRIHLLMCRYCRRYVRQTGLLIKAMHRLYGPPDAGEVRGVMHVIRNGIKGSGDGERK